MLGTSTCPGNIGEGRAFCLVSFCIRRSNISKKSSYSVGPTASTLSKSRCRHGYFHVVNNDYTHREMYAIGGSANPTINSQGNKYLASTNRFAKEALVVKLREGTGPNANTGVVTGVLATVGELARMFTTMLTTKILMQRSLASKSVRNLLRLKHAIYLHLGFVFRANCNYSSSNYQHLQVS